MLERRSSESQVLTMPLKFTPKSEKQEILTQDTATWNMIEIYLY